MVDKSLEPSWHHHAVPRYTSYPSAHHFNSETSRRQHTEWLGTVSKNTRVAVYVHIPFCKELCWFCGCHTMITRQESIVSRYVSCLLDEIALIKKQLRGQGRLVSVHFGGGSPNSLSQSDVSRILEAIRSLFTLNAQDFPGSQATDPLKELAIELDPRTTSTQQIHTYSALGFNRISLGIQDFDPTVQQAIHRIQPYNMVASLISELRKAHLAQINCDLIYGLPLQTPVRFQDTLEKVIELNPSRMALFSYAHLPALKKHQRMIETGALPSLQEKLALYRIACRTFVKNGYIEIGIDHFAKRDDPLVTALNQRTLSRNFQGYVSEATDVLIGLGTSAISQFPEGYVQNETNISNYRQAIQAAHLPSIRGWTFNDDDRFRKQVIDALMCYMRVDLDSISQAFGKSSSYFQNELTLLESDLYHSIVSIENHVIQVITPDRMAARIIASVFDPRQVATLGRCSSVI